MRKSGMAIVDMMIPGPRGGGLADLNPGQAGRSASWRVWGTTAHLTVTDPAVLAAARRLVSRQFAETEKAAARFRLDAELHGLYRAGGRAITVSPVLAELIAAALLAAERTDGDVDPTVAAAMTAVHSGRPAGSQDRSEMPACGSRASRPRPAPGWQQVDLRGRRLQVPAGTTLDLTATAKAVACDRAAAQVRDRLGVGVLAGLGGNAATAGPAPEDGWQVDIDDRCRGGCATVLLPAGAALATSRFDAADGTWPGHLIDPRTGQEPPAIWRSASAVGFTALEAASCTAAALIRGATARAWLAQLWVPARLITIHDEVITVGTWTAHLANSRRTAL